jgi:hypothetical protein
MSNEQARQDQKDDKAAQPQPQDAQPAAQTPADVFDGLKNKKPEELTPEELRLMADTMPGEGPGD